MITQSYANLAQSLLIAAPSSGSLSLSLTAGYGSLFPTTYPYTIKVEEFNSSNQVTKREIMNVTNNASDILTVTRAVEACPASYTATTQTTVAYSFQITGGFSTVVTLINSAKNMTDLKNDLNARVPTVGGLRTGLTANGTLVTDGAGAESVLTGSGLIPTGAITQFAGYTAPTGYLICDGTAVVRATYSTLFSIISPVKGTFTVTIATPGVLSFTGHGMQIGDSFYATTTGALPTGMVANTLYYVATAGFTANSFQFSATRGGAVINTSGTQSGVHTLVYCPYGLGNGSTTFNVPNLKGSVIVGYDLAQSEFSHMGETGGTKTHTLVIGEIPSHTHTIGKQNDSSGGVSNGNFVSNDQPNTGTYNTGSAGTGGAHNNLQPYVTLNFIIKT